MAVFWLCYRCTRGRGSQPGWSECFLGFDATRVCLEHVHSGPDCPGDIFSHRKPLPAGQPLSQHGWIQIILEPSPWAGQVSVQLPGLSVHKGEGVIFQHCMACWCLMVQVSLRILLHYDEMICNLFKPLLQVFSFFFVTVTASTSVWTLQMQTHTAIVPSKRGHLHHLQVMRVSAWSVICAVHFCWNTRALHCMYYAFESSATYWI